MTHPAHATWILVAHRAGALLFESRNPHLPLARIAQLENPRGRLKAGEVDSDRPGRAFDRKGGARHALSSEESVTDHIEREFVSELIQRLEHGRQEGAFERLVLVAPPKMLGKLREELSGPLMALVVASLAKDLAHTDGEDLRAHLTGLITV